MSEAKLRTPTNRTRQRAAQTVRQLREAAGLTQERCALKYGVGLRTLRDIEAGKCRMTALELVEELQLAAASSSHQEARHESPITLVQSEQVARSGHIRKEDSNTGTRSQRDVSPAALMRVGDQVLPSAPGRVAKAGAERRLASDSSSCVRRTDGVAPVAQPGSAPQPELPVAEVTRSNRVGGSRSGSLSSERGPFQNACATIDVPGRSPVALPPRSGADGQRQPAIDETSGESRVAASSGRCPPRLILNQVEQRTACAAADSRERPASFFGQNWANCLAPQAAPGQPCTEPPSESRQCSGVCGVVALGEAAEGVVRRAA